MSGEAGRVHRGAAPYPAMGVEWDGATQRQECGPDVWPRSRALSQERGGSE